MNEIIDKKINMTLFSKFYYAKISFIFFYSFLSDKMNVTLKAHFLNSLL